MRRDFRNMYFVELGSHPDLSKAELDSVYGDKIQIKHDLGNILLFELTNNTVRLPEIQERLAGIVKIGNIFLEADANNLESMEKLANILFTELKKTITGGKIKFGISIYGKSAEKLAKNRHRLGLTIKKLIKEEGYLVRYVDAKEPTLSSVIVKTNKIIESGAEFVLAVVDKYLYIGKTVSVQDFKAWSNRDYGRPARDAKSGMLPPKLARMMINLSGSEPKDSVILDPFCGSGTVLMEAALMSYKKVIGSDVSDRAIADSKKNLNWLKLEGELHQSPADQLDRFLSDNVDVIVTETYLGKPMKGNETREQILNQIEELKKMYLPSLENMYSVLNRGGKCVIAFPAYRQGQEFIRVPLRQMFDEIGWRVVQDPILYEREGQKVAREIFVCEK